MAKREEIEVELVSEREARKLSLSGIKKRLVKKYGDSLLAFSKNDKYDGMKYVLPKYVAYSDRVTDRDLFRITYKDSFAHGYTINCRLVDGKWTIIERKVTLFGVKTIRVFHKAYKDPLDALEFVINRNKHDDIEEGLSLNEGFGNFKSFRYFMKDEDNRFILFEDESGVTLFGFEGGISIKLSGVFLLSMIDSFIKNGYKEIDSSTYDREELYNSLLYDMSL